MLRRVINNIKNNLLEESIRWVLWLPVFYGAGIGIYFGIYNEPPLWFAFGLVAASALLLIILYRHFLGRSVAIILLTMALGFTVAKINTLLADAPIIAKVEHPLKISGNIEEISSSKGYPVLYLGNLRIDELGKVVPEEVKITVRTKFKEEVIPGDRVLINAILVPPPRPALPGGYDFAKFAYFSGEGATGFAVSKVTKLKEGAETNFIEQLRYNISKKMLAALPGDQGALVDAITTGNRSHLSEDAHNNLRKSGLAHLLAIAGMHQALAGGFIFLLARFVMSFFSRFSELYPTKKIAAVFAILCNFVYLMISGMPYSAIRAFIMFTFFMFGVIMDRPALSIKSLSFAAIVILTFSPDAMLGPSFQMSFAAVLALISVYELISKRAVAKYEENEEKGVYNKQEWHHHLRRKVYHHITGITLTSLIAGLATAPYSIFHFNQFVNYGILGNLLVMPITAFIVMPFIVLSMFLMPLGLYEWPLQIAGWGIGLILQIGEWVSSLPHSTFHLTQMPLWGLLIVTFGGLWALIWQGRWRYWGLVLILAGMLTPLTVKMPDIIINENGKFFAINYQGNLYFSKSRQNFATKTWLQFFAQDEKLDLPPQDVYDLAGTSFAFGCAKADIVVDTEETGCAGKLLTISRKQLLERGTHNIYLSNGKIVVETVEDRRGNRPWTVTHDQIEEESE